MRTTKLLLCLFAGLLFSLSVLAQEKEFALEKTTLSQSVIKQKLSLPQVTKLKEFCAKLGYKDGVETEKSLYKGKDNSGDFQITFVTHTMKGAKGTMDLTYYEYVQGKTTRTWVFAESDDSLYWADKVSALVHSISFDSPFFSCDNATRFECVKAGIGAAKNCSACLKSIKSCITGNSKAGKKLLCVLTQSSLACISCSLSILMVTSCILSCTE